jgi:hypothetical protein
MASAPSLSALLIALPLLLLLGANAFAYVADNHEWELTCNKDGYRLASKYPVARFLEAGAASQITSERETIYLGRSCDAFHKLFGKGSWCWANGGFRAEFEKHAIGFSRQELSCPQQGDNVTGCGC